MSIKQYTLWFCIDCRDFYHFGNEVEFLGEKKPLCLIENVSKIGDGLPPAEHHADCDYRNSMLAIECEEMCGVPDGEEPTEQFECNLDCEYRTFSDRPCDGCSSTLAGGRFAFTQFQ